MNNENLAPKLTHLRKLYAPWQLTQTRTTQTSLSPTYLPRNYRRQYWSPLTFPGFHIIFHRMTMVFYNIHRACLLNIWPVPASVPKSNRSGLWRHIIRTCHTLRWLCCKHSNNVARHDKTPVKSTLLSRDKNLMSRRNDYYVVTLIHSEVAIHAFSVWLFVKCYDIRQFLLMSSGILIIIKHLFYEKAWSILFWSHKNGVINLVKIHRDY